MNLSPEPSNYDLTQLRGVINANIAHGEDEALRALRIYRYVVEARTLLTVIGKGDDAIQDEVTRLLNTAQAMLADAIAATRKELPYAKG